MATARDLITTALRRLGAIATGEVPTADEAQEGLTLLNDMLEGWSLENLLVYDETITTQVLTASKQSYTIGSGGDIAITRPTQIDQAQLRVTTSTPNLDIPLDVLNDQQYAQIALKTLESTYPEQIYLNPSYPLATLFLYPVPTAANTLVLWTKGILQAFATLDTTASFPRAYQRAIAYNLAIEAAPEYGRATTGELQQLAIESKAVLKRSNAKPVLAGMAVPGGRGMGRFNWRTGEGG